MKMNGSQILMETLLEQGVDTIFGYPGGAVLNIYDTLYDYKDRIRHILTAHEQGAAHAADGYARSTGKVGVVLATSGPGATNLVTGIATAFMDSIPMVAITGNVSSHLLGKDSFQEIFITGITMPITKHNFVVRNVEDLAPTIRRAFQIAISDRPGPVLVDIPKDITAEICEYAKMPPVKRREDTAIDLSQLTEVASMLNESQRPIMLFGGGVVSSNAYESVRELMRKSNIPSCRTLMGTGVLPYGDPLNMGIIGMHGSVSSSKAVQRADLLFAVGVRFSDRVATNTSNFARNAKIIHVDIDPAEHNKNVALDHSIVGDVKKVIEKLLPLIKTQERQEWLEEIAAFHRDVEYRPQGCQGCELKPHLIIQDVYDVLGDDIIMTTDVGQHQIWAAQYTQATDPRKFLTSGGLGTMGFGYGASVGAAAAFPGKKVVHITGDGSFHMNLNELCTSVSNELPIITVLFNNRVLGMVYQWQSSFYRNRYSFTQPERKTDYVALAKAFGAHGIRCDSHEELREALKEAGNRIGPTVIECTLAAGERVLPMIPSGLTIDEVIIE
jgi:acetolactate synthase-1/2/3 large subunit